MRLQDGVTGDAVFSPCGQYRYALLRTWEAHLAKAVWIMLNPSTAAADVDDPTVRRCQQFSRTWGFGGCVILNLFAWRSTDPKALKTVADPVGPANDTILDLWSLPPAMVIAAWGVHGTLAGRNETVEDRLVDNLGVGATLHRLGPLTKGGHPRHPLYVKGDTALEVHR